MLWPNIFSFHSSYENLDNSNNVRITLPDGTIANSNDDNVDSLLSSTLGKRVKFISQAPKDLPLEEYWPDIDNLDNRDVVTDEDMSKLEG